MNAMAVPNVPILPIPPRIWARYSPLEWYSWADVDGVLYDLMVVHFKNGWTWSIDYAADGSTVAHCHWVTEGNDYPNEYDAMTACENYFTRTIRAA